MPGAAACDVRVNQGGGLSVDIAEGTARDEWRRSYPVAPGGRFEIVNVNGAIEARASSGTQVDVLARREVRTEDEATSKALLQKIEMEEEVAPGRVKIEARGVEPEASVAGGLGRRARIGIEYEISIPAGLIVDLRTENGAVRLENVSGSIAAASTNGSISGTGLSGSLAASTVNGGIQVEFASVAGDVSLQTVNGGVRLALPADVKATLDARAVNGGVSVDEALRFDATEQARLHIAGTLNGGGPEISAQTTNGGVRVSARDGSPQPSGSAGSR
jgi:hypothetical protein